MSWAEDMGFDGYSDEDWDPNHGPETSCSQCGRIWRVASLNSRYVCPLCVHIKENEGKALEELKNFESEVKDD